MSLHKHLTAGIVRAIRYVSSLAALSLVPTLTAASGCSTDAAKSVPVATESQALHWGPLCIGEQGCVCPGCTRPEDYASWSHLQDKYSTWNKKILSYISCNGTFPDYNKFGKRTNDISRAFIFAGGCLGGIGTAGSGPCPQVERSGHPMALHKALLDFIAQNPSTPITPDLLFQQSMKVSGDEPFDAMWTAFRYTSYIAGEGPYYDADVGKTRSNDKRYIDDLVKGQESNPITRHLKPYQGLMPGVIITDASSQAKRIPRLALADEILTVQTSMVNLRRDNTTLPGGQSVGAWYAYSLPGHIGGPWYHYFAEMLLGMVGISDLASAYEAGADSGKVRPPWNPPGYDYRRDDPDKTVANTQGGQVGRELAKLFFNKINRLPTKNYGYRCAKAVADKTDAYASEPKEFDLGTNDAFRPDFAKKEFKVAFSPRRDVTTDVPSPLFVSSAAQSGPQRVRIEAKLDKAHPPGDYIFDYFLSDSGEGLSNVAKVTVSVKCRTAWDAEKGKCIHCPDGTGFDPVTKTCKPCTPGKETTCNEFCANTNKDVVNCGGCGNVCRIKDIEDDSCACVAGKCTLVDPDNDPGDPDDACILEKAP